MKKVFVKLLAVILTLTVLFGSLFTLPISAKSNYDPPVKVGVMSDLHYFPESYTNINSVEYQHDAYCDSKLMGESSAILKATLETIAVRKAQGTYNMNFLLVSGDLTFDGEKAGHLEVAALFKAFEARTGIQIFVVNGNHDVNNYSAAKYATANGKKITASENPGLLLTSPETFKTIYSDFGYAQADSVFVPSTGKAGMLSYSVSLPGGYRLIAIDACKYSADVTGDGKDEKESSMSITPELLTWVLNETKQATKRGEAVIGMTHGSLVEHFDLESVVSKNSMIGDYERISYELADAGMHFVFTGHMHANDTSSIISGNNETIYDIETCGLSNIPNTYREASFSKGLVMGQVSCSLNNVDCDAECKVDVSGVSNKYGIIEKPFRENYASPMLYGGSIENGIRNDGEGYFNSAFLFRLPPVIKETFPNGLAGFLKEKGINLGDEMTGASPALKAALSDYNLTPQAFSQFLGAIVKQIDNKYILDTTHTLELVSAAVARFAHFEIVEGNSATQFGKIALLGLEYNAVGDENPKSNPEIQLAIDALRTQKGADRFIDELIDMVISDLLFNDILPSISLNDLDNLLPAKVMTRLRAVAGNDLTVGGILDKILNSAAKKMNYIPFVSIDNGRDLVKALVYTIGYKYLNAGTRLKMSKALADIIVSFTNDENPALLGDSKVTLQYNGKATIEPTTENYRLPADVTIVKGAKTGDVIIEWNTILGIEGSNIDLSPIPAAAIITKGFERINKDSTAVDLGFMTIKKSHALLKHTISISGLETGVAYSYKIGDSEKGLMSGTLTFTLETNGEIKQNAADSEKDFFEKLLVFLKNAFEFLFSFKTILKFFT